MVSPAHIEGREFSCDLEQSTSDSGVARLRYSCTGEDAVYSLDLRWRLDANGHLLEQSGGESKDYIRCN
ncbi:hypothetical protein SAZ10_10335 [Mesorhizobium sp. BAC0120]|uniref:hypothetical protein n=1 Tax=Mesorhizobium sp. BAC0120 TaxID=3090670 RepID=UPI00298C62EE|nr:hypothetical protein [Mesorhizobium sp. BAC0120]MDW6022160.1 hypothetical protein [Mesorhizobium sp. BAC0120]